MKLKSTTYYWLAVVFGGVGMGAAMGAEGTAQTTGYISGTLFAVSLVLIFCRCSAGSSGLCSRGQGESRKAAQVRQDQPRPRPQPGIPG